MILGFLVHRPFHVLLSKYILNSIKQHTEVFSYIIVLKNKGMEEQDYRVFDEKKFIPPEKLLRNSNSFFDFLDTVKNNKRIKKLTKYFLLKNYEKVKHADELFYFSDVDYQNQIIIKFFKNKKNKTFLIEEGIALYRNKKNKYLKSLIYTISTIGFLKPTNMGDYPYTDYVICKYPDLIISKNNTISMPNNIDYSSYAKADECYLSKTKKKIILYLGSPLSEMKIISLTKERAVMQELVNLSKKSGFKVVIKPHPMEDIEKYSGLIFNGQIIKNSSIPIESIVSQITPFSIISHSSSAMINLGTYNKRYCIYRLFEPRKKIDTNLILLYKRSEIKLIGNFDELKRELSREINFKLQSINNIDIGKKLCKIKDEIGDKL